MDELKAGDPEQLGSYRILGRLGAGGLSVVFLAEDDRGDRFAIKVLRPHLADEQRFRNRLAREAGRIMSVAGVHTARVFEVVNEGAFVHLVMEYVEGETLEKLVANGRRIQGPLLWFMAAGLVDAVREIHAAGITHRDLKPSNILIGPDGVKVTDFGFGGILDEGGFARTGTLMGSVAWLSPEQITGEPVDQRTDIFNLGLALAYIALGRHPYAAASVGAAAEEPLGSGRPEAMMYRISHASPNIEEIPAPLRDVIAQCLSVEPADRPTLDALATFFSSGGSTGDATRPIPRVDELRPRDVTPVDAAMTQPIRAETYFERPTVGTTTGEIPIVDPFAQPIPDEDLHRIGARRRRLTVIAGVGAAIAVLVGAAAVVDVTNVVDLGVIGEAESAATTTTSTTTSTTSTSTTVVPTTTLPPPPVYKLYEVDGNKYRWNPCQNPITIVLNPMDKLTEAQVTALEAFITQQAAELATMTGMTVEYAGRTEEKSGTGYTYGEEILLHIDVPGAGVLQDDKPFEGSISGDRIRDGFREIDAVQYQYNANALEYLFTGDELRPYGQWLVMLILGNSFGLSLLGDADMTAAGSTDPKSWEKEIMYFGGEHRETPTWGPGDMQGLAEVGASVGCF